MRNKLLGALLMGLAAVLILSGADVADPFMGGTEDIADEQS